MRNDNTKSRGGAAAVAVGLGIFLSRIAGFVRDRVFAHYLGNSDAAGAFRAALRIPNLLQNLFGEGVLSASFIPVYARLEAEGRQDEACRLGATIFTLLLLSVVLLSAIGVLLSRPLIDLLAPGFQGDVRELTIRLVQILFPGTALLVLSAWCLGILNSHRKFLLSYVAPVVWNMAIVAALVVFGSRGVSSSPDQMRLAELVAWGVVAGSLLQFLVQLPKAFALNQRRLFAWDVKAKSTLAVLTNFLPALFSRGVVQLSAYIDQILSSFLGPQTVSAMAYAQTIALLPVSLFGMSVSSAELPELSSLVGDREVVLQKQKARLEMGLRRIAFFVIPSVIAFLAIGDQIVGLLYQTGKFKSEDTRFVWWILAGYSLGILASTLGRLCVSVFWAAHDTKTPARFALYRVLLNAALGYLAVFPLRAYFHLHPAMVAALLAAASGVSGWTEFALIRWRLRKLLGGFHWFDGESWKVLAASLPAAGLSYLAKGVLTGGPALRGVLACTLFALIFFFHAILFRIPQAVNLAEALRRRARILG